MGNRKIWMWGTIAVVLLASVALITAQHISGQDGRIQYLEQELAVSKKAVIDQRELIDDLVTKLDKTNRDLRVALNQATAQSEAQKQTNLALQIELEAQAAVKAALIYAVNAESFEMPIEGVHGGVMRAYDAGLLQPGMAFLSAEDGHVAGGLLIYYTLPNEFENVSTAELKQLPENALVGRVKLIYHYLLGDF